ncbi:fibrinogen C domain-containing protein 1 [Elysia marginata]|uniref:Fibrinogen C domain-containing protein 1 n=1 Tax=Elysia marginata TaxID=1093978 RepID=A0AAV4GSW6_9GAST|nr:fibrinogen C domain-containing protein 1 [Elysia marginata]
MAYKKASEGRQAKDQLFSASHHDTATVCSNLYKLLETGLSNTSNSIDTIHENLSEQRNVHNSETIALEKAQLELNDTFNSIYTLTSNIYPRLENLQDRLGAKLDQLEVDRNNSAAESRSAFTQLKTSIARKVEATITEFFTPNSCRKGAIYPPPQTPFPYPVIYPHGNGDLNIPYLCDPVTDDGGWVIIQRRSSDAGNFYRGWQDYKDGFGTLDDNFWLGNKHIYALTSQGKYELRVDMGNIKGKATYAHYSEFSIDGESNRYTLRLGTYSGTAGDSLSRHNGRAFSTFDKDNDRSPRGNCAVARKGAWWYDKCNDSNLNGNWADHANSQGAKHQKWGLSYSEMKIRRVEVD